MRKLVAIACSLAALGCWSVTAAFAARNPSGTGQPGVAGIEQGKTGAECGAPGSEAMPKGFETAGFEHAAERYAGSPLNPNKGNTAHAIAEYDVACFQQEHKG